MNNILLLLLILVCLVNSGSIWANSTIKSTDNTKTVAAAFIQTKLSLSYPVVKQKVTINYEIAVSGFFNGETRFELPSLSRAVLARSSNFAINGSRIIAGKNYATQIWQIDLYPEHSGLLEVPALRFSVNYMDNNGKQQHKTLQSDNLALFAYLPEPLKEQQHYVVSSQVDIIDTWSTDKVDYQIGDIIIRELTISVADIKSIQIPPVLLPHSDGLQISTQEPKLSDESNRGQHTAMLEQTITYVVKQAGNHQLGGEIFTWWHLENGLQQSAFTAKNIDVSGTTPLQIKLLILVTALLLCIIAFVVWFSRIPRRIKSQLKSALAHQQWSLFINLLYKQGDAQQARLTILKAGQQAEVAEQLLICAYQQQTKISKDSLKRINLKKLIK